MSQRNDQRGDKHSHLGFVQQRARGDKQRTTNDRELHGTHGAKHAHSATDHGQHIGDVCDAMGLRRPARVDRVGAAPRPLEHINDMALNFARKKKDQGKKDELTKERMVSIYTGMLEGSLPMLQLLHS